MKKIAAGILLLVFATSAQAERESWYLFAGLGAATGVEHPDRFEQLMSELDTIGGTSRVQVTYRIGLYLPVPGTNLLVGGTWNGLDDQVATEWERVTLTQAQTGASVMYSFGNEPGVGLFVRGDYGTVQADISYDCDYYLDCNRGTLAESPEGTGRVIMIGYGFALSGGARMLVDYSMAEREIAGETYTANALNAGLLW